MSFLSRRPVPLPPETRPILFIVVDTEEEFDWSAPFSRSATSVTAIRSARRLQRVAQRYGVKPTYVIDYPIATSRLAGEVLGEFESAGKCTIGAHLHPWVNPPYTEPLGATNSYACNLAPALERAKISRLKEAIWDRFGVNARVYKAGRYGFGRSSAATLEALGFDVDMSVNPAMDYRADGGPSFVWADPRPFVFGAARPLLEIPCTTAIVGALRRMGHDAHAAVSRPVPTRLRVPGILARLGLLNKVMLSPEGNTLDEMKALARRLFDDGVRTFSLTLHSPTLAAGHTRYGATHADVEQVIECIEGFLEFFFTTLRGAAGDPLSFHDQVCRNDQFNAA